MKYISHRGNINCITPTYENSISYIENAINLGYDVEIDVRRIDQRLFLGHDTPDYELSLDWLLMHKNNIWIHTKNFAALAYLIDYDLKTFYHKTEEHTIINNCNLIWSHNLQEANEKSIIPLLSKDDILNHKSSINVYGVCSDFVELLRDK